MGAVRPVDRDVVAAVEELAIGSIARADVEHSRFRRKPVGKAPHGGEDALALERALVHEGEQRGRQPAANCCSVGHAVNASGARGAPPQVPRDVA